MGNAAGIPTPSRSPQLGREMVCTPQYFLPRHPHVRELGATYIKTYYVEEEFETITAGCPVPIS